MIENVSPPAPLATGQEKSFLYSVVRYTPDLVRDEWVNIGLLLFDPRTGERRFRLIEEEAEFHRVRRLHPQADEALLRSLQADLESRFEEAIAPGADFTEWEKTLLKWDATLSNILQLAPPKASFGIDLDAEVQRLYEDHVGLPRSSSRIGQLGSRASLRSHCSEIFRNARLWDRLQKSVRVAEFTFPGDPMRLDYSYRRNGTRGFVQTLSVSRAPADAKLLAYTAERIHKARFASEFTAVTDVALSPENPRHRFVHDTLRDAGVEPVPMEGFAVWVAKLRPMLQ
jgi:hypothetical protein